MSFRKASRLITYITSAIPPLLLMALIIFASYPMLVSEVKAAPAIIYSDPQDGWVNSVGGFSSAVPTMFVGDNSFNQFYQSFVKFSLSGISGTLSSAKLMLYVYRSDRDGTSYTTSPLQPPNGLGDTLVLHIADYGTLSASALNAPSIGNDPGVLLSSSATPNVGYVSIDVTAAMQDDINKGRAFSAFMIKTSVNTDNNNDNDAWWLSTSKQAGTNQDPYIEYALAKPVGGIVVPTNKFEILAPYLALAGLVIAVSTVVVVKRRSKD